MPYSGIIWDLDDDPEGKRPALRTTWSLLSKEEIEEVLQNATDIDISRSSGRPVVFGDTTSGRHLMVVYKEIDEDTAYPVTAYEVPRRHRS